MKKEDFFKTETIDAYLQNSLSIPNRNAFEEAIQTDTSLQKEVQIQVALIKGIKLAGEQENEERINDAEKTLDAEGFFDVYKGKNPEAILEDLKSKEEKRVPVQKNIRRAINMKWWLVAASIVGIVVSILFFTKEKDQGGIDFFVQEYIEKTKQLEEHLIQLSEFGLADKNRQQKESLLHTLENYKSCESVACEKTMLQKHLEVYPSDRLANYYLGMSQMGEKDYKGASRLFSNLSQDEAFEEQAMAQWNLALCLIQLDKRTQAKSILNFLQTNPRFSHQEKAEEVLKKLH